MTKQYGENTLFIICNKCNGHVQELILDSADDYYCPKCGNLLVTIETIIELLRKQGKALKFSSTPTKPLGCCFEDWREANTIKKQDLSKYLKIIKKTS